MRADGSQQQQLTFHVALDFAPVFSPDGERLLFMTGRDANTEIYDMRLDGTDVRRLTDHPGDDRAPMWVRFADFSLQSSTLIGIGSLLLLISGLMIAIPSLKARF
jgi:TolB protein